MQIKWFIPIIAAVGAGTWIGNVAGQQAADHHQARHGHADDGHARQRGQASRSRRPLLHASTR